ncbi:MAG: hypothetical protein ACYTDU_13600 [Planctomycetota bacterium]
MLDLDEVDPRLGDRERDVLVAPVATQGPQDLAPLLDQLLALDLLDGVGHRRGAGAQVLDHVGEREAEQAQLRGVDVARPDPDLGVRAGREALVDVRPEVLVLQAEDRLRRGVAEVLLRTLLDERPVGLQRAALQVLRLEALRDEEARVPVPGRLGVAAAELPQPLAPDLVSLRVAHVQLAEVVVDLLGPLALRVPLEIGLKRPVGVAPLPAVHPGGGVFEELLLVGGEFFPGVGVEEQENGREQGQNQQAPHAFIRRWPGPNVRPPLPP